MPAFRSGKPRVRLEADSVEAVGATFVGPWPWHHAAYQDPALWPDGAPDTYTPDRAGLYVITAGLNAFTDGTSNTVAVLLFTTAGIRVQEYLQSPNGSYQWSGVTTEELALGDTVQLFLLLITADGTYWEVYGPQTNLTVTRVGPVRWT